jgi:hypothetical protein
MKENVKTRLHWRFFAAILSAIQFSADMMAT